METLIPMTDFVLEQERIIPNELNTAPMKDCDRLFVQRIILYARFLKQPLAISMFVPTDEDGKVLEEPEHYKKWHKWGSFSEHGESIVTECKKYFESKKRVLFHIEIPIDVRVIKFHIQRNRNVEWLINKDFPKIKLTETAKKQIGLI